MIAHHFETDKDIVLYRSLCHATKNAVDGDNYAFWRAKFCEKYDVKHGTSNKQMRDKYRSRSYLLRRGLSYDFFRGHHSGEIRVAQMLKDLIIGE